MDQTRLKKLLELANPQDQVKLKVLYNAVVKCIRDYQADSTAAKLKDWKSAEKTLDAFIEALWGEHFGGEKTLPNLLAVVDYLSSKGWKIRKSAAYQHHKDGKIRPAKNGAYRITDAEKYAHTFLKRMDGGSDEKIDAFLQEKHAAEAQKLKAQARHWDMKAGILEGIYVEKGLFERELARRAAVFRNDIQTFIRSQAAGIINLAGGDASKTPDLIEYMLVQAENWLSRYAEDREFTLPTSELPLTCDSERDFNEEEGDDGYYGIDAEPENGRTNLTAGEHDR